jgi:Ca-activated chloride channel family protein
MHGEAWRHWFAWPDGLTLLLILPVLTVIGVVAAFRRRGRLIRLGRLPALAALTDRRGRWQWLRGILWSFGLIGLALATAAPQWGIDPDAPPAPGCDVIVVLDVSRSMLTDDVPPDLSRFEHAKKAIADLADAMQKRGGHRVGLVAFTSRAVVLCPLTPDFNHFREKLADLDAAALPPELVPAPTDVSGTRIGAGIRAAVGITDVQSRESQTILLLSDGDDPADEPTPEWLRGADEAQTAGVRVYTVGIGDPENASPVPAPDGRPLMFEGREVMSKLEEEPLKQIARRTNGTYTASRTGPAPLGWLFRTTIEPGPKHDLNQDFLPPLQQRYAWFLGPSLLLLVLEMTVGGRARKIVVTANKALPKAGGPTRGTEASRGASAGR